MKKSVILFFMALLILIIPIMSWAEDLTRSSAKKVLEKRILTSDVVRTLYAGITPCYGSSTSDDRALEKAGYITVVPRTVSPAEFSGIATCVVTPTAKLNPYIIGKKGEMISIKVADTILDEITGITKISENKRKVQFRFHLVPHGDLPKMFYRNLGDDLNRVATISFTKYDDGWRIGE